MGNGTFTIAKGMEKQYASLPAASDSLIAVLLRGVEPDDLLRTRDTLADVLLTNTQANFTNYVRKTLASITVTIDDNVHTPVIDWADFSWTAAGGAVNNTIVKVLACYVPSSGAADSLIIPIWFWDALVTTDGQDLNVAMSDAGVWRSTEVAA